MPGATAVSAKPPPAPVPARTACSRPDSQIDGYATPWNSQQHVNYIGQDGHVHELVYKDSGGWSHSDLNQSALANN